MPGAGMKQLEQLTDDGLPLDLVGAWSEDKYRLVLLYASMFTRSMRRKFPSLVYLDLFSGPGRVQIRNTSRIYASSPVNALDVDPHFDRLIFCELEDTKLSALKQRCALGYSGRDVHFVPGDVNANVQQIVQLLPPYRPGQGVLALCFVDPYRMSNLHFSTLEALGDRWIDFLVLIPSEMDAQRGEQSYVADRSDTVAQFVGNPDWRSAWENAQSKTRFEQFIVEEFGRSMARIGCINPDLSTTHLMKNSVNRSLYRLVLYSRREIAGKFWQEAQRYAKPNLELF